MYDFKVPTCQRTKMIIQKNDSYVKANFDDWVWSDRYNTSLLAMELTYA